MERSDVNVSADSNPLSNVLTISALNKGIGLGHLRKTPTSNFSFKKSQSINDDHFNNIPAAATVAPTEFISDNIIKNENTFKTSISLTAFKLANSRVLWLTIAIDIFFVCILSLSTFILFKIFYLGANFDLAAFFNWVASFQVFFIVCGLMLTYWAIFKTLVGETIGQALLHKLQRK